MYDVPASFQRWNALPLMELEVESNSPLTARFGSTFHEIIFLAGTSCRNVYLTFDMLDLRTTVVPAIPVDSNLVTTRRKTTTDYCRNVEIDPPTTTEHRVSKAHVYFLFWRATTNTKPHTVREILNFSPSWFSVTYVS